MHGEMHSIYCKNCHKLLLKAALFVGEIKCNKCKEVQNIKFISQLALDNVLTRGVKTSTMIT